MDYMKVIIGSANYYSGVKNIAPPRILWDTVVNELYKEIKSGDQMKSLRAHIETTFPTLDTRVSSIDVISNLYFSALMCKTVYNEDQFKQFCDVCDFKETKTYKQITFVTASPVFTFTSDSDTLYVTIRGTASVLDFLTDLSLKPTALGSFLDAKEKEELYLSDLIPKALVHEPISTLGSVHEGMAYSGRYVFDKVNEHMKEAENKYKNILVQGHSLGAGAAAVLTLLCLIKYGKSHNVRGIGFATPSCMGYKLCSLLCGYFISVVYNFDPVPRLGIESVSGYLLKEIRQNTALSTNDKLQIQDFSVAAVQLIMGVPGKIIFIPKFRDTVTSAFEITAQDKVFSTPLMNSVEEHYMDNYVAALYIVFQRLNDLP